MKKTKPKRIILIFDIGPCGGGVQTYFLKLAAYLQNDFYFIFILSPQNPLISEYRKIGRVHLLNFGAHLEKWRGLNLFSPFNLLNCLKLFKIIQSLPQKPEWILVGALKELFLATALFKKLNLKIIYFHHTAPPFWLSFPPFFQIFKDKLNLVDRIISVSDFTKKYLRKIIGSDKKIIVIKNGVDEKMFSPPDQDTKDNLRQQLGIPKNSFIIGNVARIVRSKGHCYLIGVAQEISKKIKNFKFLIVGEGPSRKVRQLKKIIRQSGLGSNFIFVGFQKNPQDFYKIMDIFVFPSEAENLPLTVLEAMSTGIPVVAFDVGGLSEIIKDKDNGFLVPKGDILQLSKIVVLLFKNPNLRVKIGEKARDAIEKNFVQKITFSKIKYIMERDT